MAESAENGAIQIDGHWIGLNWPLAGAGVRSSAYGMRTDPFLGIEKAHGGIDIAAPFGTDVLAALGGRILKTGAGEELGNFVIIAHSGTRETIYGHLSKIMVKEGQFVNSRKAIGKVGNSGRATGAHLHFAVKKNGRYVDPQKWMVPTGFLKI
jgi:murein DD-endopeptidase MepM/ murein hydrolase activator NlpD